MVFTLAGLFFESTTLNPCFVMFEIPRLIKKYPRVGISFSAKFVLQGKKRISSLLDRPCNENQEIKETHEQNSCFDLPGSKSVIRLRWLLVSFPFRISATTVPLLPSLELNLALSDLFSS